MKGFSTLLIVLLISNIETYAGNLSISSTTYNSSSLFSGLGDGDTIFISAQLRTDGADACTKVVDVSDKDVVIMIQNGGDIRLFASCWLVFNDQSELIIQSGGALTNTSNNRGIIVVNEASSIGVLCASGSGNTPASFSYPVMSCISTLSSMNDVTIDTALLSFSQIVSNGGLSGASVLPVHWLDFRLENGSEEINLIWQTASETNCSHFIVQRSIDALKWEDLARLEGHGNSSVIQSYTYKDESPVSKAYYRITQFDYDGSQTYSGILRADFRDVSDIAKVYPNPSNGKVLIEIINQTELRAIRVCSLTGQDLQLYLSEGYAHYEIELPKGMYYLLIEDLSGRRYMKLIVVI